VSNVWPELLLTGPETGNYGEAVSFSGETSDFPADPLRATIDFGDGIVVPLLLEAILDPAERQRYVYETDHFFGEAGVYSVTVTVIDHDGGEATQGVTVHVGPPAVLGVVRNDGAPTPYELTSIAFIFSDDVGESLDYEDLSIYNNSTGEPADLSDLTEGDLTYDGETFTARWDLAELLLGEGLYTAYLAGDGIDDAYARALDGNQDGTGGDDYQSLVVVAMAGDVNADGSVGRDDFLGLRAGFGMPEATWLHGDSNHDGAVDYLDYMATKRNFGRMLNFQEAPVPVDEPAAEAPAAEAPAVAEVAEPAPAAPEVAPEGQPADVLAAPAGAAPAAATQAVPAAVQRDQGMRTAPARRIAPRRPMPAALPLTPARRGLRGFDRDPICVLQPASVRSLARRTVRLRASLAEDMLDVLGRSRLEALRRSDR